VKSNNNNICNSFCVLKKVKIIYITPAVINRLTISLLEKKLAQKEIAEIIGISTQAARKQI